MRLAHWSRERGYLNAYSRTRLQSDARKFHEPLVEADQSVLAPAPMFYEPWMRKSPQAHLRLRVDGRRRKSGYPRAAVRISPGLTICIVFASFAFRSEERGPSMPSRHANPRWMRPLAQESAF